MDFNLIIRKTIEILSDFFSIKAVKYLSIFIIITLIIGLLFGNKKVDIKKEIITQKQSNEKLFEQKMQVPWEEFEKLYERLEVKIRLIIDEEKVDNEADKKIKQLLLVRGSEYQINVSNISKNEYNVYDVKMTVEAWKDSGEGEEGTFSLYGTVDMKVKYENERLIIIEVLKFTK